MSSTIICKYGNKISLGGDPNDNVYHLCSQHDLDDVSDVYIDSIKFNGLVLNSDLIIECINCGRLIRESEDTSLPGNLHTTIYQKEEEYKD
ncbi:MAG: hypothetical protein GY757_50555 [bacterium]|nr:hypothetical protein [bacterium]